MTEKHIHITPEQARELSQKYTNWQEVCQYHLDIVVPEACKRGERKAVFNLTEFIDDATKEDIENIRSALENIGWEVEGFQQVNSRNVYVYIAW